MLGDLFYRLGTTAGQLEAQLHDRATAGPRQVAFYDADSVEAGSPEEDHWEAAGNALFVATGGWLLSRLLRPRPVSWPRVVLAGAAATVLSDGIRRALGEPTAPGRQLVPDDPEELMARLGAGVALAAGYAAILYPRLPGPPLVRGLLFGALEVVAAPTGGVVRLAQATPGLRFPLQDLALVEDAGPLARMAFGLGLGLFYRD